VFRFLSHLQFVWDLGERYEPVLTGWDCVHRRGFRFHSSPACISLRAKAPSISSSVGSNVIFAVFLGYDLQGVLDSGLSQRQGKLSVSLGKREASIFH